MSQMSLSRNGTRKPPLKTGKDYLFRPRSLILNVVILDQAVLGLPKHLIQSITYASALLADQKKHKNLTWVITQEHSGTSRGYFRAFSLHSHFHTCYALCLNVTLPLKHQNASPWMFKIALQYGMCGVCDVFSPFSICSYRAGTALWRHCRHHQWHPDCVHHQRATSWRLTAGTQNSCTRLWRCHKLAYHKITWFSL